MEIPEVKSLRKTDLKANVGNKTTSIVKDKPRRKKRIEKKYVPPKPQLRDGAVAVRTTFYCPFFGVVRMTTHVSNYEAIKEFV
ncbi:unnamed protein product [Danaus chrysippus]|uniref:(African queen) hypothetical protein n=1 Tax=Danaus chrysippus TaxID=151541 RepID=A0A8J2QXN2_9NEOP|nr:unnamed protein product [Danaus chrysippus]